MLPIRELNLNVARELEGRGDYRGAMKFYALANDWEGVKHVKATGGLTEADMIRVYENAINVWERQMAHEGAEMREEVPPSGYEKRTVVRMPTGEGLPGRQRQIFEIARAHFKAGSYAAAIGICRENNLGYLAGQFAEAAGLPEVREIYRAAGCTGDEVRVAIMQGASPEDIVGIHQRYGRLGIALTKAREAGLHAKEAEILTQWLKLDDMRTRLRRKL